MLSPRRCRRVAHHEANRGMAPALLCGCGKLPEGTAGEMHAWSDHTGWPNSLLRTALGFGTLTTPCPTVASALISLASNFFAPVNTARDIFRVSFGVRTRREPRLRASS